MYDKIQINRKKPGLYETQGMGMYGQDDFTVSVPGESLHRALEDFVHTIVKYAHDGKIVVRSGERVRYGYWIVEFVLAGDGKLEVWELRRDGHGFVPGLKLALTYWLDQHRVCQKMRAHFAPPSPNQLVVISNGVMEGDLVQGIRYFAPEHMSGWWITTARYDGDINTLTNKHLWHVTAKRPELAKYLALPFGYRFSTEHGEDVWFDQ